jgi:membrane protease YdiL (CAAX protease family)
MQVVFVATSIIVAIKEEFLYRGVLQNVLETKGRPLRAVILSNIIFMLYHYGAQPFTIGNLTEIFTAGCILGFIYASSGSLMLVIVLHAIYDAIWSLTPVLTSPLPRSVGSVTLVVAFVLCVVWVTRSNHRFQLTALPCFAQQGRS